MSLTTKTFSYAGDQEPSVLDGEDRVAVIATLLEWLRLWLSSHYIDGEYIADGGALVGGSRHSEMDLVVWEFLCSEPTSRMYDVITAFLYGYWARQAVSHSFPLDTFATALDTFPVHDDAYAGTALALYIALSSPSSRLTSAQQAMIRKRLLIARGKILSHNVFPHVPVSLNYLVEPGQSHPIIDVVSYRGYRCDDGPNSYFVVERIVDHTEVLRVHDVVLRTLRRRTLKISYEIVDSRHLDVDMPPLISAYILRAPLEDRFRGQVDDVDYVNIKTDVKMTLPYDEAGD
jgi:hypothetical protein